jgi:hypothetical protein
MAMVLTPAAVTHEGLHAQWAQSNNADKDKFYHAYNQAIQQNPALGSYLSSRLRNYKQAPGFGKPLQLDEGGVPLPNPAYNNIGNLSPTVQNEVHSYIPEFYVGSKQPIPKPLAQYYSQYFNTNKAEPYATYPNRNQVSPKNFPKGLQKLLGDY